MKENHRFFWVLLIGVFHLHFANGQNGSSNYNYTEKRPIAEAHRLNIEPTIDGLVQNDAVWDAIHPFGGFWQVQPKAGKPASEKTEVRIGYTTQKLFISVICYDKNPEALVVSDARRDASLENTDGIIFILDTYKDGQNGFVFGTNPLGIEYDAQVDNEGQGNFNLNRQQGGMIGGFNLNWDAAWLVKAFIGDFGWSAEFAIPLRTLRYAPGENQTWGINFRRNIRKSNEIAYWSPIPIEFNLNRLSLAGSLTGLNLKNPGNLKLIPYALGNISKNHRDPDPETELTAEFGADLKYSITPSLTLDLTYNTDFAQVEVDEQQINLDRFNLFFPEKRPFFLENAGLFGVGSPGEVDLFFSRRIGLGDEGEIVPIIGGGRLSGKIKKTNIGFLSMFTDDLSDADIGKNNFTVARVNHEFAPRSAIGAAFINREGLSEHAQDYNRVFAADGKIGIGQKALVSGFYARSVTPGIDDGEHAFNLSADYTWSGWEMALAYTEVGEGFNPEVGFLLRDAFRKPSALILYHWRMNGKWGLLELRPHISYRSYWNIDGSIQTSYLHIDNHWEWESGFEVHTGTNFTTEGVSAPFEIAEGVIVPAGKYQHQEAQIVFRTNQSKTLSISTRHILGGFLGGKRYANSATMYLRFGDKFNSEFSLIRNDIELPYGDFSTNIFRSRLSYSFTPRIYVQGLLQYNSVINLWSTNIRFGWLQDANTGLFLVYNELHDALGIGNRGLTLKYSRVFDILQ
jgi:hypothetical protein